MKYLCNSGFIFLMIMLLACSENKKELITKEWSIQSMKVGDRNLSQNLVSDFYMKFNKDGTCEFKETTGIEKGSWQFNDDKTQIITKINSDKQTFDIELLNDQQLVLSINSEGVKKTYKATIQ